MKSGFAIFFAIVLAVHTLVNTYIYFRGLQAIPTGSPVRTIYTVLFLFAASAYIVGQILESNTRSALSDVLVWIGAFWMAAMVYFLLTVILLDLLRLFDHFFHFFPAFLTSDYQKTKLVTGIVVTASVFLALLFGHLNARNPRVKHLELNVDKSVAGHKSLRVVAISDTHLGSIIGRERLQDFVAKINSCNPDIVLMGGDQIDGNPKPVIEENMGELMRQIKSKYGVYAITGNHEYIGNAEVSCKYLNDNGIQMLRDTVIEVEGVYIVGREDRSAKQFAGKGRKDLKELVAGLDTTKPMLLLDHQPFHLEEAEQNGIDFQFSGHTHHAQIWPLGYITKAVYEVSWGYKKKSNTHVYVSCGAGTWGPPVRIGNTPEIMDIVLNFK